MKIEKPGLDGVHLVAMKDGQPVPDQSQTVVALIKPLVAAVLRISEIEAGSAASSTPKTTEERIRRISDLEIECATLRHGLRLADRRYEDAMAAQAVPQDTAETELDDSDLGTSSAITREWRRPAVTGPDDGELRRAVKEMTRMLNDREWAEHLSGEPDASALEAAITELVGEATEGAISPPSGGMPLRQEPKYGIREGRLFNRASGHPIPDHEPVFIFRGKDKKAVPALHFYAGICDNPEHVAAVQARIVDFQSFSKRQTSEMKQPDTDLSVLDEFGKLDKLDNDQ